MEYLIKDRQPVNLYHFFEDISAIPRVSKNEAAAASYVVSIARKMGYWYYEDDVHNVLIRIPASHGYEHARSVLLAGHLDMVGEKTPESKHDFQKDPIKLIEDGNILRADGTTLGADNGCAVAIMLCLMTDKTLIHPPLECLFTVQEELGLLGAKHFDCTKIHSRIAIGLDAGSDGVFRKGTSTKFESLWCLPVKREIKKGKTFRLFVGGLRGGDQGAGIPLERISAIKMTARVLYYLNQKVDLRLICIDKVGKSIPENCTSYVSLEEGAESEVRRIIAEQQKKIRNEYKDSDPGIEITLNEDNIDMDMLSKEDNLNLINALWLMPYGARGRLLSDLSEVTISVVSKKIYTDQAYIHVFSVISTEETERGYALDDEISAYMKLFGFKLENSNINYGWPADDYSYIRDVMKNVYYRLFKKFPKINISHGGNDCVIFKQKIPDLDLVTTAATYRDFHTPNEYMLMDSFENTYSLIVHTLEQVAKDN